MDKESALLRILKTFLQSPFSALYTLFMKGSSPFDALKRVYEVLIVRLRCKVLLSRRAYGVCTSTSEVGLV